MAGKCKFIHVDIETSDETPNYILDAVSETSPFVALYNPIAHDFSDQLTSAIEDGCEYISRNLLVIDRLEVLPEYRGCGLARVMLEDAIRLFSRRIDIVALKAFPLQFEAALRMSWLRIG